MTDKFIEEKRIGTTVVNVDDSKNIDLVFSYNTKDNVVILFLAEIEVFKADWDGNLKQLVERMSDYFGE